MRLRSILATTALALTTACVADESETPSFTAQERLDVLAYWAQDGRYEVTSASTVEAEGEWQVRQTVEASRWLWSYFRLTNLERMIPNFDQTSEEALRTEWDLWIDAKVEFDRARAQTFAAEANAESWPRSGPSPAVVDPGPAPEDLVAAAGTPPPFYEVLRPRGHVIRFDDFEANYDDAVPMRTKFPYYRSHDGVMDVGRRVRELSDDEVNRILEAGGVNPSMRKVLEAVSLLEGGFESVNTYDTGFVSVGFIQFASLSGGAGSLGSVLRTYKEEDPDGFQADFRRFGIDVRPDGRMVALDLDNGSERIGPGANERIIRDKRLIAVFQRAGAVSDAFRATQVKVAVREYYPADDVIAIDVGGELQTIRVGDVFRSEAGMATMMDRKVNRGTLNPLPDVIATFMAEKGISDVTRLSEHERELVELMEYRKNYLEDPNLGQPS